MPMLPVHEKLVATLLPVCSKLLVKDLWYDTMSIVVASTKPSVLVKNPDCTPEIEQKKPGT